MRFVHPWMRFLHSLSPNTRLMVAVSSSPAGIFEMVNPKANIEISGGGDFNLMIDHRWVYISNGNEVYLEY